MNDGQVRKVPFQPSKLLCVLLLLQLSGFHHWPFEGKEKECKLIEEKMMVLGTISATFLAKTFSTAKCIGIKKSFCSKMFRNRLAVCSLYVSLCCSSKLD